MPALSPLTTVDSNSCENPAPGLEMLYFSDIAKNFDLMQKLLERMNTTLDELKKLCKIDNNEYKLTGKHTLAKDCELMHKDLGQIEKRLDDWKKLCKIDNVEYKLTDENTLELTGLSEAVLPVAQDCSDGANNYGLGNSPAFDTDAKADGQESADFIDSPSSAIPKLAVSYNGSVGGLRVQESTKTDELETDKTSTDNTSPTSGNQSDVFPTLEATTAVPVNVKSDQPELAIPAESEVQNQSSGTSSATGVDSVYIRKDQDRVAAAPVGAPKEGLLPMQNMTDSQRAELHIHKVGLCWQVVEINLRPFFNALDDINSKRSLLENAMFPGLLRTFVKKTMDFDEDDYKAFKPSEFISQEKSRLKNLLTSMNTMFYDVLQVYLDNGTFEKSVKDLLFFLHKNNRRGSVKLAKHGEIETKVFLEEHASFGGYEKLLYDAVIAWRKFFFSKTLERSLVIQEDCLKDSKQAGDRPHNSNLLPNYKESMFFHGRAEYYRKLSNINCMQEKTPRMLTMAWCYEALKNAPNSQILNRNLRVLCYAGGDLEKAELFIFKSLFSTNCDGKFYF